MKHVAKSLLGVALAVCTGAHAEAESDLFHLGNESELGYVVTAGNADASTFNARQENAASWSGNKIISTFKFLRSSASGTTTARSLFYGLRYERRLVERISLYGGGSLEANQFAGFDPRWSFDLGARWKAIVGEQTNLGVEGGYRYLYENRVDGTKPSFHLGRAAFDVEHKMQEMLIGKLSTEILPNFTKSNDFMINGEVSLIARLSAIFSFKTAYQVKFRNVPAGAGLKKTDTALTLALLAKF